MSVAMTELVAGFWNVDLRDYHESRDCESHTTLEEFRDSSSTYHQVYNLGTLPRREPSDALMLGTALHAWVLEPGRFADLVAIGPAGASTRTKKFEEFEGQARQGRKIAISADQFELVKAMGQSLRASPIAGPLVFDAAGRNEQAIRWQDPETGIWLKAAFDRLLDCGMDLNLKTSRDPSPRHWAKDSANFGYERQQALYVAGKQLVVGQGESLHVVVGSEPPHLVGVFELGPAELELGRKENQRTLSRLAFCREADDWRDAWESEITPISYPRWAFTER